MATAFLAVCLILPGNVLHVWEAKQLGSILEADKEYYSRQMAAYTGDLNLYRKLLMTHHIWKSKRKLVTEQNFWSYVSNGDVTDNVEGMEIAQIKNTAVLLGEVTENLYYYLRQTGNWYFYPDAKIRVYEYQDAVLEKYRFQTVEAVINFTQMESMDSTQIRLVCDPETNIILAIYVGKLIEETFLLANGMEIVASYMHYDTDTGVENRFPDSLAKSLKTPEQRFPEPDYWENPEDFQFYEQFYASWSENSDHEELVVVVQDDSYGFKIFLSPEE